MRTVVILLFDEVEILDATGPFEVFSVASRLHAREAPQDPPLLRVCTVASSSVVTARHGLQLLPNRLLGDCEEGDILIIPGGVVDAVRKDVVVLDWVRRMAQRCELVCSVCTGSFILAQAGLLEGRRATTHWEDVAALREAFPSVHVVNDARWTQDGNLWTSAGISSGIDMSLRLIAHLESLALANRTARQMEYEWTF
jgi:transcriptional regulator GlxA family with amidase domain